MFLKNLFHHTYLFTHLEGRETLYYLFLEPKYSAAFANEVLMNLFQKHPSYLIGYSCDKTIIIMKTFSKKFQGKHKIKFLLHQLNYWKYLKAFSCNIKTGFFGKADL